MPVYFLYICGQPGLESTDSVDVMVFHEMKPLPLENLSSMPLNCPFPVVPSNITHDLGALSQQRVFDECTSRDSLTTSPTMTLYARGVVDYPRMITLGYRRKQDGQRRDARLSDVNQPQKNSNHPVCWTPHRFWKSPAGRTPMPSNLCQVWPWFWPRPRCQ